MRSSRPSLIVFLLLGAASLLTPLRGAVVARWHHATFEEFRAGTPGNSGHNLYVDRDGRIRTIRRFDLNQDGHLDLLFNSTHDWYHYLPASLAAVAANRTATQADISVLGSSRVFVRDLNRDGHLDLFFHPNRQNLQHARTSVTIIWGGEDGWPAHRATRLLPVNGSTSAAVADLNGDGWPDLVTLNSEAWLPGQPEGRIVRLYWGGPDGYQLFRYADVGVPDALELAAGDFDGSGFDDLAVLSTDGSVRIFWSSAKGEDPVMPEPVVVKLSSAGPAAETTTTRAGGIRSGGSLQTMAAGDIDRARGDELVVGTRSGQVILLAFSGRQPQPVQTIRAFNASHITVGDADGDGWPDLVLTDLELGQAMGGEAIGARGGASDPITILWGGSNGLSRERSLSLAVPEAIATAIGDYDGDGRPDLAVAVHQGQTTTTAESLVFFGDGSRGFQPGPAGVTTQGAMHPATVPGGEGAPDRVIFCNSLAGTLGEAVPLYLYWGTADGFSEDRLWKMPFRAGYKSLGADLRGDGHVDIVVLNSGHGLQGEEHDPEMGAHVYWGAREGGTWGPNKFDLQRRTILQEPNLGSSNVADLNRDGYLDLVLGAFETRGEPNAHLVIRYGSAKGFTAEDRVALENEDRTIGCLLADFDQDGWLDIVVLGFATNRVTIFQGGSDGYSEERKQDLLISAPIDAEAADLNGDGWLDLLIGSYWDPVAHHHDAGLTIFWGGPEGLEPWNAQWLPGWTPIGIAVADLDADGHLDIVSPHYHAEMTREDVPSYIYWGGADGYSVKRRTSLSVNSAHDVMIGDYDGDGRLDLAFSAHSNNNGHRIASPVFYNDGRRFANPRASYLPTSGTHFMAVQDIGNIVDRSFAETYDSAVLSWDAAAGKGRVEATADTPPGTRLEFLVRSAPDRTALDQAPWQNTRSGRFPLPRDARALQYRVRLVSPDGDRFPVIESITLSLSD